ncbi:MULTISPECIES: hypothetical protein [unclassified Cytobacillus]|uniref:hypothetical protein n=1 Tax=unclassified Cytobacillus TaxID=2675268 RepID=UPI0020409648|nr:hypothetical protein [Cytobacillus sp. AMY 15.2]MCM3094506.1 hypothetical protein [Cytobacillus sp. AMY 15.2]
MDKRIQVDVINDFYGGKILNISKKENGCLVTIDLSEYNKDGFSLLRCNFINCTEFQVQRKEDREYKNINELHNYKIELNDSYLIDSRVVVNCELNGENNARILIETEGIKVFDEFHNEVSLLDLSITSGLCSSGAGIDFAIGITRKEAALSENIIKFNEELHGYLINKERYIQRYHEKGPKKEIDLLIGLDPYGDKIFTEKKIQQLIVICDRLSIKYHSNNLNDQKIRYFAEKLKELCIEALQKKKRIFAFGD